MRNVSASEHCFDMTADLTSWQPKGSSQVCSGDTVLAYCSSYLAMLLHLPVLGLQLVSHLLKKLPSNDSWQKHQFRTAYDEGAAKHTGKQHEIPHHLDGGALAVAICCQPWAGCYSDTEQLVAVKTP